MMRIIAGEFRGRKILPPATGATRPITDRVKQSLFDILAPNIEDSVAYDCFAGTGSMGLECLSRGARKAVFFEQDRSALGLLRKNIESLGVQKRSQVVPGDLFAYLSRAQPAEKANLFFLDPPYRFLQERPDDLQKLARSLADHFLAPGATVIFRHDAADSLDLPPLLPYDRREYGGMVLELLRASPQGAEVVP